MNKKTSGSSFNTRAWTEKEMEILYALRLENIPYRLIALDLKRSVASCEKKYRATNWTETNFYDKNTHRMKEDLKRGYGQHLANLNDRRLQSDMYKTDLIADKLVSAIEALPIKSSNNRIVKPRSVTKYKHSNEDVGLLFSDTHIGHEHSLEETGGISEYNQNIFYKRIETLKRGTEDIVELHSHLYKIPTLHIFCLGDIVAGMNNVGNWSPTYINMPIYDQMISGYDAISDMIYYWLDIFDDIKFYGVAGNHGRGAPKGFEKEYVNWDFLCYKFLESRFSNNPRVKFVVPKTWWILEEIRHHKFLLIHGEDVRGGGTPLKGLQTYEQQMIGVLGQIPDYTLAAHFHNAAEITTNHGKILFNGSFVGSDIYSLKNLQRSSRAEQKIFGIHDKRGITWSYNLHLDEKL